MERHAREVRDPLRQLALAVFGEEEGGVAEPGHDDPLHAAHDLGRGRAVAVDDGREAGDPAVPVAQRDVLLMVDEDGLEDLGWLRAELRRDDADHDRRVLDEVAPLLAQAVVVERDTLRCRLEPLLDAREPVLRVHQHEALAQALAQLGERADADGLAALALGQEAVAARDATALEDERPLGAARPGRGSRTARRRRPAARPASGSDARTGRRRGRRRATRPSSCAWGTRESAAGPRAAPEGPRRVARPATFLTCSR